MFLEGVGLWVCFFFVLLFSSYMFSLISSCLRVICGFSLCFMVRLVLRMVFRWLWIWFLFRCCVIFSVFFVGKGLMFRCWVVIVLFMWFFFWSRLIVWVIRLYCYIIVLSSWKGFLFELSRWCSCSIVLLGWFVVVVLSMVNELLGGLWFMMFCICFWFSVLLSSFSLFNLFVMFVRLVLNILVR